MSHQDTGTCEVCRGETYQYCEYKELLYENHCLSEDCGFFKVESKIKTNWSGSDYRTPEEVREFIEEHELGDELDEEPCPVLNQVENGVKQCFKSTKE